MMDVLSYPFRFASTGRAVTVAQNSNDHFAQQIGQFVQTRQGELALAPGYGIADPVFNALHPTDIAAGLAIYHPSIRIKDIRSRFTDEGVQAIDVSFDEQSAISVSNATAFPTGDGLVTFNA